MVIGIHKTTEPFEFDESGWFEHEKPSVLEAFRVLAKEGYYISISGHDYNEREKRLKKEYEENTKSPGPSEEQPEEKKGIIYPTTFPKADFYYKHVLNEGNPALKEAASQFNDALLDEQAKKIEKLTKENEDWKSWSEMQNRAIAINNIAFRNEKNRLGKEIARLNKIIRKKNLKIEELRKESSRHLRGEVKFFGETVDLSQEICDKNEELRLSKIREKNLTEVGQKYMNENEKLKKKLADKIVNEIDARALKSAESALAYKEKVIAEKDEVIADLGKELKAKHKKYVWYKGAYEAARQILNTIADYAAKHPDKKFSDQMVGVDIAEEGGDHSAIIARCCKNIAISKDEAEIIERCTKNGTELHYSEKDGFTYTNMYGEEIPIIYLRGMFQAFTDEEIKNMKK